MNNRLASAGQDDRLLQRATRTRAAKAARRPAEVGPNPQGSDTIQWQRNAVGAGLQADLAAEVVARPPIVLRMSQTHREADLLAEQVRLAALRNDATVAE